MTPNSSQKKTAAFFLLGILSGAIVTSILQATQLDRLYLQVRTLKLHNDDLAEENAHLSIQLQQPRKIAIVHGIQVDCTTPENNWAVALAASSHVKQELTFLVGKELDLLIRHPDLPARILDGQTFSTENKRYRLKVTLIVIGETLYIQVKVNQLS